MKVEAKKRGHKKNTESCEEHLEKKIAKRRTKKKEGGAARVCHQQKERVVRRGHGRLRTPESSSVHGKITSNGKEGGEKNEKKKKCTCGGTLLLARRRPELKKRECAVIVDDRNYLAYRTSEKKKAG